MVTAISKTRKDNGCKGETNIYKLKEMEETSLEYGC